MIVIGNRVYWEYDTFDQYIDARVKPYGFEHIDDISKCKAKYQTANDVWCAVRHDPKRRPVKYYVVFYDIRFYELYPLDDPYHKIRFNEKRAAPPKVMLAQENSDGVISESQSFSIENFDNLEFIMKDEVM